MQVKIELFSRSDGALASRMLARAFAEDPIITHYLSNSALPAFFRAVLEEMFPAGHVYPARFNGNLVGVAAWIPPGAPNPDPAEQVAAERHKQVVENMFP